MRTRGARLATNQTTYNPQQKQREILIAAWDHVQSVEYGVSARWLFYRLLQDGFYTNKADYHNKFKPLFSRARKDRFMEWRPWTLSDDTRAIETQGDGWQNEQGWLSALLEARCELDRLAGQSAILAVLFEAKAMKAQFKHYLPEAAILFPFGGDPSIPSKWKIAEMLAKRWRQYRVPVCVVYFGDLDDKGQSIETSAKAEILDWASAIEPEGEYRWHRGGLDREQAESHRLPVSIDGKGFQWEALSDEQAQEIIGDAVDGLIDRDAIAQVAEKEDAITTRYRRRFADAFGMN